MIDKMKKGCYNEYKLRERQKAFMIKEQRYNQIIDYLFKHGTATISQLTDSLGVSEATVRRDLIELSSSKRVVKVHGGAMLPKSKLLTSEDDLKLKQSLGSKEKQEIGRYAARLINDDDFVFIDAGSTCSYMIDYIPKTNAVFITNSLENIKKLCMRGFNAMIACGYYKPVTDAVVGADALGFLKRFNFSKCFIGVNGISSEAGYTTPDPAEASIKGFVMEHSYMSYVLADSSKFNKIYPTSFSAIPKACIITDRLPDTKFNNLTVVKETSI